MRAEFPAKSPMVGLNCARAIFMLALQNTVVPERLQTPSSGLCRTAAAGSAGILLAFFRSRTAIFPVEHPLSRGPTNKKLLSRGPGAFKLFLTQILKR